MTIRYRFQTVPVAVAALMGISAGLPAIAQAQQGTASTAQQSAPRIDPIAVAVAAVNPADTLKSQIDTIIARYQKERESASPAGQPGERPQLTPEQREQAATLETKEVAEIKAVLPADQQAKFQTAYDTAKIAQASAPILTLLSERLHLTEEEKNKITPIIAEYTEQTQKLRQDTTLDRDVRREKSTALWDAAKAKIRPLLTPDKQTTLDGITSPRGGRRPNA